MTFVHYCAIIDIVRDTNNRKSMQNPAKFPQEVYGQVNNVMLPEEIYLISGEDNRGQTVQFGFCYSKEEAREAIIRYAKKGFFWCKYEVINVLGDETNDCE